MRAIQAAHNLPVRLSLLQRSYIRKLVYRQRLVWEKKIETALDVTLELSEIERKLTCDGMDIILELLDDYG